MGNYLSNKHIILNTLNVNGAMSVADLSRRLAADLRLMRASLEELAKFDLVGIVDKDAQVMMFKALKPASALDELRNWDSRPARNTSFGIGVDHLNDPARKYYVRPTPVTERRNRLATDVEKFLRKGGQIEEVPSSYAGPVNRVGLN